MKALTPEMIEAGKQYLRIVAYKTGMKVTGDLEAGVRKLYAAPDSPQKRHFIRATRKIMKSEAAEQAADKAGLYSPSGLYAALCDLAEHAMAHGKNLGKKTYPKYKTPAICSTSDEARAVASDMVAVVKRATGIDLMDPAGSLRRKAVRA